MSADGPYLLWAGTVFDDDAVLRHRALSFAGNGWQRGLIDGLLGIGLPVRTVGHLPKPRWPKGRLVVGGCEAAVAPGVDCRSTPYLNIWRLRDHWLAAGYRLAALRTVGAHGRPIAVFTYNAYYPNARLGIAAQRVGVPWVAIVAEKIPRWGSCSWHDRIIRRAAGRVFLPWQTYLDHRGMGPALHLDGGVAEIAAEESATAAAPSGAKGVLYAGSLMPYAGVGLLAEAFRSVGDPGAELWICGKGDNPQLAAAAAADRRIRLFGAVTAATLADLYRRAIVLVNPRLPDRTQNASNFPSKILEYMRYGKPIVTTWTPGLAPEYRELLIVAEVGGGGGLGRAIDAALALDQRQLAELARKTRAFVASRMWSVQARRLAAWLEAEVLPAWRRR